MPLPQYPIAITPLTRYLYQEGSGTASQPSRLRFRTPTTIAFFLLAQAIWVADTIVCVGAQVMLTNIVQLIEDLEAGVTGIFLVLDGRLYPLKDVHVVGYDTGAQIACPLVVLGFLMLCLCNCERIYTPMVSGMGL